MGTKTNRPPVNDYKNHGIGTNNYGLTAYLINTQIQTTP